MKNTWIIIKRELKVRLRSVSFWAMAILGPIILMLLVFLLFHFGENQKPKWKVLIVDPAMIMDNRIMLNKSDGFHFDFYNQYLELDDFIKGKRFQSYDGFLELNEKTLSNKTAFFFYREKPTLKVEASLHYLLEKRLEEVYVQELTKIPIEKYREIKRPINLAFRNVYDPKNQNVATNSWVGWTFGALILFFITVFGMAILRSITLEKSNRIVEVLLATIRPRQLMLGKIVGIGLTALIQLVLWISLIAIGMYFFRESFFPTVSDQALAGNLAGTTGVKEVFGYTNWLEYNQFVELIYNQINFGIMLPFAILFLILGYLFYGTFFAGLGAMLGTESDGQQYIFVMFALLLLSLLAGYLGIVYPENSLVKGLSFVPFTSPVLCMVRLSQGYAANEIYQLYVSIGILILSIILGLKIAERLYQKGILRFGRRLHFRDFF